MTRPGGRSSARRPRALPGWTILFLLLVVACGGTGPTPAPDPAPELVASAPAHGATGVAVDTNIVLTFSEAMDRASVEAALSITPAVTCAFTWSSSDTVLTCDPSTDLALATAYTVTVATSATDAGGTALATIATVAFETAAGPGPLVPAVVGTVPRDGETDVALNRNVQVSFSEAMDAVTTEAALSVVPGVTCDIAWNAAGTTATCVPQADFAADTTYTLSVTATAESRAGVALGARFTSTFTTGASTLGVCTFGASVFGACVFGP